MSRTRELLLIDAGERSLQDLAGRLQRLGYRALAVKTPGGAREVLCDPRHRVAAVVVPPDLAVVDLRAALDAWRAMAPDAALTFLAAGLRPGAAARQGLRQAGVRFGLWEPVDAHTLRFLINHALASDDAVARERRTLRVPVDWRVRVRTARHEKEARLYSLSANGAFLATDRPLLRRALVHFSLPLPSGTIRATGRVVMTNVPGNLLRRNLPVGMGVAFTGTAVEDEASLQVFAEERYRELDP